MSTKQRKNSTLIAIAILSAPFRLVGSHRGNSPLDMTEIHHKSVEATLSYTIKAEGPYGLKSWGQCFLNNASRMLLPNVPTALKVEGMAFFDRRLAHIAVEGPYSLKSWGRHFLTDASCTLRLKVPTAKNSDRRHKEKEQQRTRKVILQIHRY